MWIKLRRMIGMAGVVMGLLLSFVPSTLAADDGQPPLTVLLDQNYPPYAFSDDQGQLQGILPDLWRLWSQRTGRPVLLRAMDWGDALRRFQMGEGDVIDTIFRTPSRDAIFRFSEPYVQLDVSLLFDADLSGIRDGKTARGFAVGVKDGDACVEELSQSGVTTLIHYPSYDRLIAAAESGELRVFCVDKTPAVYLLTRKGLDQRFRATPPLYSGQFHWAVRRGQDDVFQRVRDGFDLITPAERQAVTDQWLGIAFQSFDNGPQLKWLQTVLLIVMAAAAALGLWIWGLRRTVRARTAALNMAAQDLAISERWFRAVFDNINDAIFIQDAKTGQIITANQRVKDLYGYEPSEILSLTIADLSHGQSPYGLAEARQFWQKSAFQPQIFEWQAKRKDGTLFWVEVAIRRADLDGQGDRLLVVVRDIDGRKRVEADLRVKNAALQYSNNELEQYAYAASHDLREPLRNICSFSTLLSRRLSGRLDQEEKDYFQILTDAADRMNSLVLDLLEISRIGRSAAPKEQVDLNAVLASAMDDLRPSLENSHAKIEVQSVLPVIWADFSCLKRVLSNILSNSIKFSGSQPPYVIVSCRRQSPDVWRLDIKDHGIGLEKGQGYEDRIFGLFKRLHQRHEYGGGTGTGLPLCRKIIQMQGGSLWAESDGIGLGTRIVILLPATSS